MTALPIRFSAVRQYPSCSSHAAAGASGHLTSGCAFWCRLDGSAFAEEVLAPARELSEVLGAELLLLRVVESSGILRSAEDDLDAFRTPRANQQLAEARHYLEDFAGRVWATGMAVATRVVVGPPATSIAEVARESGADLIAMATHGRGGLARLVLGSVAMGTLQQASAPLLLVRPAGLDRRAARQTSTEPAAALLGQATAGWTNEQPQE